MAQATMVDHLSKAARSNIMRAIKSTNTKPELTVRRLVFGLGYRYRLRRPRLPGRPDLIFPGRRKVIFVHGCFWHGHFWLSDRCRLAREPQSESWQAKLRRNTARDIDVEERLLESGWAVLTLWECELDELAVTRERIISFLGPPGRLVRLTTQSNCQP